MLIKRMYIKLFLLFICIIGFIKSFCQELVFQTTLLLEPEFYGQRAVLPIVLEDKTMALFLLDNLKIQSLTLNKDFHKTDEYGIARPQVSCNTLIGHSIKDNDYCLFFTNNNKNRFFVQTLNLSERKNNYYNLSIKLKKEKYLDGISHKDKFYLLTIKKPASTLKIYEFEGSELRMETEFDLSKHKLARTIYPNLFTILSETSVTKINIKNPTSLQNASRTSKLYISDDKIFITIDDNPTHTKLIELDLKSYEYSYNVFLSKHLDGEEAATIGSNSFLIDQTLFQVKSGKSTLVLTTKDIIKNEVISEYSASKSEVISFKNGSIKQKGGISIPAPEIEIDNTKQALRKIANSKIGVSAYQSKHSITLTIGGYKVADQAPGVTSFVPETNITTPSGNIVSSTATYSHNPMGYENYQNSRSVYFQSILDSASLKHIDGEVDKTAYDKIILFEKSSPTSMSCKTTFRIGKTHIFGYYDKSKKVYSLYKFLDNN